MFKFAIAETQKTRDFSLNLLCMTYVTLVISSIVLFNQLLNFHFLGMTIRLSGALVPYVFLYPVSFIVLRIYGLRCVNSMIGAMLLVSLVFVLTVTCVAKLSSNQTGINSILLSSFKMYLAGFVGMPAGIYVSFLILKWLSQFRVGFNVFSLTVSTIVGELVNTIVVFPLGFHGEYSWHEIFSTIIVDALVFKALMSVFLSLFAIIVVRLMLKTR